MEVLEIVEIGVILLFVASLVGILVDKLRLPYTVGLVLVGLSLAFFNSEIVAGISPEDIRGLLVPQLILGILVPPLIFEAAFHIQFENLKRNLPMILAFAIPGVVTTMFLVGGAISWGTGIALPVALVFGALIAATDPVAVVALFRTLGVPKRLQTILEGESLFNDGTAIVIYNLMLAVVATGSFSLMESIWTFFQVAGVGFLVGLVMGSVMSFIMSRIDDNLIEITLTAVAAFGSYLIAEEIHTSGVLAVVAAGLISGNIGQRDMSPTTRLTLLNFWEYAAFLANSVVFLLIGLVIDLNAIVENWPSILLAISAVLVARAVVIYSFSKIGRDLPTRFQHVVFWGGLRGAISLALALSLPVEILDDTFGLLQSMAFGVVLFTLLVQGISMGPLVKRLKLIQRSVGQDEYERSHARAAGFQAAYDRVREMSEKGLISKHTWQLLKDPFQRQIDAWTRSVREIFDNDRNVEISELNAAYQEGLRSQRGAYSSLYSSGAISEKTFSDLVSEVDTGLTNQGANYPEILLAHARGKMPISRMLTAIVREEDVETAMNMMNILGVPVTRLSSMGGAAGKARETLLIGIQAGLEEEVVQMLAGCCTMPVEFRPGLLGKFLPSSKGEEMKLDGMSIYIFDIDHYEEI